MFVRANDRFAKHTQNHMRRLLRNLTRPSRNICNPENPNNFGFPPHSLPGKKIFVPGLYDRVTYDFGIPSRAIGEGNPQSEVLAKNWDPALPTPKITSSNDFWITSFTHLRTSWAGNTFADTKGESRDFHLNSGEVIQVAYLKSESSSYPYLYTDKRQGSRFTVAGCSSQMVATCAEPRLWSKSSKAIPKTSTGNPFGNSPPCWESSLKPCFASCD